MSYRLLKMCAKHDTSSVEEVAELLGILPNEVSTLTEQRSLPAIKLDGKTQFPTWQFDENGIVPRIAEVAAMLDTASPVGIVRFFLTYKEELAETPLNVIKSQNTRQSETIDLLAAQFNQHLAR